MSIKEHIKGEVTFQYYFNNELWYKTESGFEFPVPTEDIHGKRQRYIVYALH
jgi:hypothetical protein